MVGPNFRVGKKIGCGNFGELRLGELLFIRLHYYRKKFYYRKTYNRSPGLYCILTSTPGLCQYQYFCGNTFGTHYVYWAPLKYTVTVQFMFR